MKHGAMTDRDEVVTARYDGEDLDWILRIEETLRSHGTSGTTVTRTPGTLGLRKGERGS